MRVIRLIAAAAILVATALLIRRKAAPPPPAPIDWAAYDIPAPLAELLAALGRSARELGLDMYVTRVGDRAFTMGEGAADAT